MLAAKVKCRAKLAVNLGFSASVDHYVTLGRHSSAHAPEVHQQCSATSRVPPAVVGRPGEVGLLRKTKKKRKQGPLQRSIYIRGRDGSLILGKSKSSSNRHHHHYLHPFFLRTSAADTNDFLIGPFLSRTLGLVTGFCVLGPP